MQSADKESALNLVREHQPRLAKQRTRSGAEWVDAYGRVIVKLEGGKYYVEQQQSE